ncbi:IS481 family transposase [Vulgatibacter incomptus]|uniref:IS481 family transposase n=1 Tax=Vulgatibacter incomptus TaxID=1391653 RepID=UPI001969D10F|nr:IS481 family transposase [Vulgatibacter incomptus]
MDERVQLVSEYLKGVQSMTAICRGFGVSRKTAYKWVSRYQADGPGGLEDRSRAPLSHPSRIEPMVVEALLTVRRAHPHWGPRKILAWLGRKQPQLALPSASTGSAILAKYGLARSRQARRRTPPFTDPFADADAPNRIWCADFKGDFKKGDGKRCYPVTFTDGISRYLLKCRALRSTKRIGVQPVFEAAFHEFGLPDRIRTDNGTPFASRGAGGLSQLSVWWVKLGICHERIEPGRPDQNGRHERMHRTLKQETISPAAPTFRAQQARFDRFQREYNEERPHEALGNAPPSSSYVVSPRSYPSRLPEIHYRDGLKVRKVAASGRMRWNGAMVTIGHALEGEWIGLEEADGLHHVYFGNVNLGFIDDQRPSLGLIRPPTKCWARVK